MTAWHALFCQHSSTPSLSDSCCAYPTSDWVPSLPKTSLSVYKHSDGSTCMSAATVSVSMSRLVCWLMDEGKPTVTVKLSALTHPLSLHLHSSVVYYPQSVYFALLLYSSCVSLSSSSNNTKLHSFIIIMFIYSRSLHCSQQSVGILLDSLFSK